MKITNVKKNTLGEMVGLKPGDRLLKINGKKLLMKLIIVLELPMKKSP